MSAQDGVQGVSAWEGCVQEVCVHPGVSTQGQCKGVCVQGEVCVQGGVCPSDVHLPPVNRITDRCKNITFLELRLRTVNIR